MGTLEQAGCSGGPQSCLGAPTLQVPRGIGAKGDRAAEMGLPQARGCLCFPPASQPSSA